MSTIVILGIVAVVIFILLYALLPAFSAFLDAKEDARKDSLRDDILGLATAGKKEETLRLFLDSDIWGFSFEHMSAPERISKNIRRLKDVVATISQVDPKLQKLTNETKYLQLMEQQIEALGVDEKAFLDVSGQVLSAFEKYRVGCESHYYHAYRKDAGYSGELSKTAANSKVGREILKSFDFLLNEEGFKIVAARRAFSFVLEGHGIHLSFEYGKDYYIWISVIPGKGEPIALDDLMEQLGYDPPEFHTVGDKASGKRRIEAYNTFLRNNLDRIVNDATGA